jgi:hypothetical protein
LLILILVASAWPQVVEEEYRVYTEHPRLFLNTKRLRLLKRERERSSLRWQQFDALMSGGARMPEPGFTHALYSRVTDDPAHCRIAIDWALGPTADLRQAALVFDWCQSSLTGDESARLQTRIRTWIGKAATLHEVAPARDRTLAAIALADHDFPASEQHLRDIIRKWWRGEMAPVLQSGKKSLSGEDVYPLFEILHAVQDNLKIDLRENAPGFFRDLPVNRLLSYYPASYPAPENEYRIPAWTGDGEPDLDVAALSRAADLAMTAYDANMQEHQFLQGWLIHDRFLLRGAFGTPYEFLWANPYQPGLSYYHMPLAQHDARRGLLFLRSSWDDDAVWLGAFDGEIQLFENGQRKVVKARPGAKPVRIGDAMAVFASGASRFNINDPEVKAIFVVGLKPGKAYEIEVDDEEMREISTDAGGVLAIDIFPRPSLGLRLRPAPAARPAS